MDLLEKLRQHEARSRTEVFLEAAVDCYLRLIYRREDTEDAVEVADKLVLACKGPKGMTSVEMCESPHMLPKRMVVMNQTLLDEDLKKMISLDYQPLPPAQTILFVTIPPKKEPPNETTISPVPYARSGDDDFPGGPRRQRSAEKSEATPAEPPNDQGEVH